jgi:Calx-beta domain
MRNKLHLKGRRRVQNRNARFACTIEQMEPRVLLAATTIADWTFQNSAPATSGPISPEIGSGAATGGHTATATYSSPSGNGSTHSYSATPWAVGDYWQFQVNATGFNNITLAYDQISSGTGPQNFQLEYSTTGTTGSFINIGSPTTVQVNGTAPAPGWITTGGQNAAYTFTPDLSAIQSSIINQTTLFFRLPDSSTVSANGGTVGGSGTDRIDNVVITGTPDASPQIGSLTLSQPSVTVNQSTLISLTANNVTEINNTVGATISSVAFYQGTPGPSNPPIGTVTSPTSGNNWTLNNVQTDALQAGVATYFAVATDSQSPAVTSSTSTTLIVNGTQVVSFDSTAYSANESAGTVTITVDRTDLTGGTGTSTVDYSTSDGSHFTGANPEVDGGGVAGTDYTAVKNGVVTFPAGSTNQETFTIPILNVKTFAGTRTFNVTLSQPSGSTPTTIGTNVTTTVTITDNTITAVDGIDTPTGLTTETYTAEPTGDTGVTNGTDYLAYENHNSFAFPSAPEMEFGSGSTVLTHAYNSASAIDSVRLSLFNTVNSPTDGHDGVPGSFDVYLLTNDSYTTNSLTYAASGDTGPAVLSADTAAFSPTLANNLVGTATFTNNVIGYNDFTFDNLNSTVENALLNYFNGESTSPIRFIITPHANSLMSAAWQGNVAPSTTANVEEQPQLTLLVEKSNNIPESFSLSTASSNTPLGTINKGDGSNDNDSLTFFVTRTGNITQGFDSDSVTVPYTLTGPDVNGVDYILSGSNAPATSTATSGKFTFTPSDDQEMLTVTTIGAPNTANISADRSFTLTLGTPMPTANTHIGLVGSPSSETVTVHDARTLNAVSTNTFNELATIEGNGPRVNTATPPVVVTTTWQAEGSASDTTPTAQFASYAIAEFNNVGADPSDVFFPNDNNDTPGSSDMVGSINAITLNTVNESGQSFSSAGVVNVYLIAASATPSWPPSNLKYITTAEPEGINGALGTQFLLGSFTIDPKQSTTAYTSIPLTGASPSVLATLISDLNNTQPFDIVLANEDAGGSFNVEGDPTNGLQANAPEIGFNYTPAATPVSTPTWLNLGSTATTFSTYGNNLTITGTGASIVFDPGGDAPVITNSSTSSVLSIPASAGNTIHVGGMNLTGGSSVTFASVTSTRSATNHRVLVFTAGTNNISFDSTSKLDLKDNDAIFLGGGLSTITADLKTGIGGGLWTGNSITSSSAAANPSYTSLGVEQNDNPAHTGTPLTTTFDGQVVSDSTVLVKYTYVGDALLAGTFGASNGANDYISIDAGFNSQSGSNPLTGWTNGDFNYDGKINGDDYTLIDNAFNHSLTLTATPLSQVAASGVPAKPVFSTGAPIAVAIPPSEINGSASLGDLFNDKKSLADEVFDPSGD